MKYKVKNLIGRKFGRLTVISESGRTKQGGAQWMCECKCGNKLIVASYRLQKGTTKSCGCIRTTHGNTKSRLYHIWGGMKARCNNLNNSEYSSYGGRGIKVCDEWNSFECFQNWSHDNGYANDLTIDRIDNDKGYSPDNCRWVTFFENRAKKRNTILLNANNQSHSIKRWSEILGIPTQTFRRFHKNKGSLFTEACITISLAKSDNSIFYNR